MSGRADASPAAGAALPGQAYRRAMAVAIALLAAGAVGGCAQPAAPVVDLPVRAHPGAGEPVAAARPAPSAGKPAASGAASTPGAPGGGTPAAAKPAPVSQPTARAGLSEPPAAAPGGNPATPMAGAEAELAEFYTVKKGDTLYSIALDHGQGYRDVAAWNGLADPNVIKVDQQLRVRPPPGWKDPTEEETVVARGLDTAPPIEVKALEPPPLKRAPKAVKLPYSDQALAQLRGVRFQPSAELAPRTPRTDTPPVTAERPAGEAPAGAQGSAVKPAPGAPAAAKPAAAPPADAGPGWAWPTRGALLHGFDQGPNPKGIAIGGEPGQPILAGASGKVVYSGSGLRGYGKLIIIKHDATYLSVYGHNRELLVKEGERVTKGQKIAEMGSSEAQRPELHFEIRKLGKPVDPLQYLPAQGG
jgi:lipoprotein NlpD